MPLVDQPAVVVDLETTGANPALDRITEVGVLLIEGGEVVREWSSLVNPEAPIPPFISSMTGITDAMVAKAPTFRELRHEIADLLRGRIFIAHNARFDYGFLSHEFRRVEQPFQERVLCSVKLSRRLWPEHRSHGLDAIMARHGIQCADRHRALGDAKALWEFLCYVQDHVPAARIGHAVAELLQQPSTPSTSAPVAADALPESPGVYRFYGEGGVLLYVGKCGNLRARVMAYFSGGRIAARDARLARQVRHVDWIEAVGELDAMLMQARLIAADAPKLNRTRIKVERAWSLALIDGAPAGPRWVDVVDSDGWSGTASERNYGLFRSRRAAEQALRGLAAGHTLCASPLGLTPQPDARCDPGTGSACALCSSTERPAAHFTRLIAALAPLRLEPWPYRGRIGIKEHDTASGRSAIHVVDRWRYLGTARSEADLQDLLDARSATGFDADHYRLFSKALLAPATQRRIVDL